MARIIDYEQDDDKPFGVGTHYLDDGTSYYLDDPERARSVLEELYGKSDFASDVQRESTNIAERGSADRKGEELDSRQKLENAVAKLAGASEPNQSFQGVDVGASRMRRAVAGPGGGDEPTESREETESRAPEENMSRAPEPPAPSPGELREAEAARRWQNADALVPRTTQGTDARALGPGVPVAKSYSHKGGLPVTEYDQQAQGRATAYQGGNELVAQHYREDEASNNLAASRLESEALAQRKANAQQALALQKKDEKYQGDRAWLEKDVDDYYDKSKVDPDRRKKERGAFGNLATVVAQFMGAYAATITGAPNFANQILNRKIDADIDAQLEDFRRGKMKRDGQLQRMAERGMSIDQMKSALKVQQELALQKEVKASALREGTRESKQAAESLLMDRQERFINAENDFRTKALGEETVSGEMVRPKAKTPLELAKERNALLGAQVEGEYLARGGAPAERAEERQDKRGEAQGKQSSEFERRLTEYSKAREETVPQLNKTDRSAARIREIYKTNTNLFGQHDLPGVGAGDFDGAAPSGFGRGARAAEVKQIRDGLITTLQNMTPGNHSDADRINSAKELLGSESEAEFMRGVTELERLSSDKRAELESSVGDDVRNAYDERRKKLLVERAKKKRAGAAGEEY